jgi:hypothetical protein
MNWIVMTVAVAVLGACSPRAGVEGATDGSLDTGSVVQRVNDIYTQVFDLYGKVSATSDLSSLENTDSLYCSADWNRWIARVDSLNQQNGVIDILDVDHWIMGQDWGELSVSDIKVFLLKGDSAAVEFQLHNLGNMINVVLDMVHEDGEWKIDNFTDITNGMDWKATMKRYLEDEQANR